MPRIIKILSSTLKFNKGFMKIETSNMLFFFFIVIMSITIACKHDPFVPVVDMHDDMMQDTTMMDTTVLENPCDTNIIYFNKDVLPLLKGNCAYSGCHDAATASDGVILDNYEAVISTGEVSPFNLSESELYEVLIDDDPEDVMPPSGKLDNDQIALIASWILQGADNLNCDEFIGECNTENVSYELFVAEVFKTQCNGCHDSNVASGGIITDNYESVKSIVDSGRLFGTINWDNGFSNMPKNQEKLDSCTIVKIKSWIDEGALDN